MACAVGTFLDVASDSCKPCPAGSYQSEAGQLQCTPCPAIAGQPGVTQATGARSAADCKGEFYNTIYTYHLYLCLRILKKHFTLRNF